MPTSEGFLCILMLLALSADDSLSAVHDTIVSGLSTLTSDHTYTLADIVAHLDYEQQAHSMTVARTVSVPAEAHVTHGSSNDSKQSICSNCKKPCHTSEFCIQPGGSMAGKSIAEAQQAHDAKHGKKGKDKLKDNQKGAAGNVIQVGNQAFIVNADGNTCEIIGSAASTTAHASTVNTAHFLQTDDLSSVDPLVLDSLCTADVDEYANIAEYTWLSLHNSFHASVDWGKRRRRMDELDLTAIMAAPLSTSSCQMDLSLETLPFLLDSMCTTHISPD